MENRFKTYSVIAVPSAVIAHGGGNVAHAFRLNNFNRGFKIRSIYWDAIIYDNATQEVYQDFNTKIRFWLSAGVEATAKQKTEPFVLPAGVVAQTGQGIYFFRPAFQTLFESWYVPNFMDFTFNVDNNDPACDILYNFSLAVEIEDTVL